MAWINGQWVDDGYDKGPGFDYRGGWPSIITGAEDLIDKGPFVSNNPLSVLGKTGQIGNLFNYDAGPIVHNIFDTIIPNPETTNDPYSGMGDSPGPGGGVKSSMLSPAPQPRFAAGYTGDTSLDVIGGPMQPPPFGDRPGMPNLPPQMNPAGYDRGPQMQTPFGGMLGDITQWNPVQTPEWQPALPPQMQLPMPPQVRLPNPPPHIQPGVPVGPPIEARPIAPPRPPLPPSRPPVLPTIPPVMEPPVPPHRLLPPDLIFDPPPDVRPRTDHEFNVAQREKTKARLAQDRAKTKKHYAKLRAKGASKQTIAKAKAKSKARGAKIKAQHPTRRTITIDN